MSSVGHVAGPDPLCSTGLQRTRMELVDRKSTRLNSSHANISYAVFCLKKKKNATMKNFATRALADRFLLDGRSRRHGAAGFVVIPYVFRQFVTGSRCKPVHVVGVLVHV